MSMSDYRRPADYQITKHYRCGGCGREIEVESCYSPALCCGMEPQSTGESYPANSDDWHEERDNVNDEFRNRRRRNENYLLELRKLYRQD